MPGRHGAHEAAQKCGAVWACPRPFWSAMQAGSKHAAARLHRVALPSPCDQSVGGHLVACELEGKQLVPKVPGPVFIRASSTTSVPSALSAAVSACMFHICSAHIMHMFCESHHAMQHCHHLDVCKVLQQALQSRSPASPSVQIFCHVCLRLCVMRAQLCSKASAARTAAGNHGTAASTGGVSHYSPSSL